MADTTDFPFDVEPRTRDGVLVQMQEEVERLAECLVLERTGVRDGDGSWHGSDPVLGTIQNLAGLQMELEDFDV